MDIKTLEQYIDKYSQISQSMMNSMYVIQKDAFANSPITSDQFNLMNAINSREDCTSNPNLYHRSRVQWALMYLLIHFS